MIQYKGHLFHLGCEKFFVWIAQSTPGLVGMPSGEGIIPDFVCGVKVNLHNS
jgi:hypothetical protein